MTTQRNGRAKWSMVVDSDRCSGCQACVVACQAENNIPLNEEDIFKQRRAMSWIRIERYWEVPFEYAQHPEKPEDAPFDQVKARFLPVLCQHCENAPCEPVCPVFATYHNDEGLNVQIYNRCIGTRFCANNDPYNVRFFNYWEPGWPETLRNQLNPDVTVRSRGVMERCSFCIQRIRRAELTVERQEKKQLNHAVMKERNLLPACVHACPTNALSFGDQLDESGPVKKFFAALDEPGHENPRQGEPTARGYRLLDEMGTKPNVIYLKKVEKFPSKNGVHG